MWPVGGWSGKASLRRSLLGKDKKVKEGALRISDGRVFWSRELSKCRVLRQSMLGRFCNSSCGPPGPGCSCFWPPWPPLLPVPTFIPATLTCSVWGRANLCDLFSFPFWKGLYMERWLLCLHSQEAEFCLAPQVSRRGHWGGTNGSVLQSSIFRRFWVVVRTEEDVLEFAEVWFKQGGKAGEAVGDSEASRQETAPWHF